MSFISLLTILAIGIILASMITKVLKGVILLVSGLGICFYLFLATPSQRVALDDFSNHVNLSSLTENKYVKSVYDMINTSTEKIVDEVSKNK